MLWLLHGWNVVYSDVYLVDILVKVSLREQETHGVVYSNVYLVDTSDKTGLHEQEMYYLVEPQDQIKKRIVFNVKPS